MSGHGHKNHPTTPPQTQHGHQGHAGTEKQIYGIVKCHIAGNIHPKGSQHPNEVQYHLHANLTWPGLAQPWDCAVNVGTTDADDLLNYRLVADFHHPVMTQLESLSYGFHNLTGSHQFPALDFLRSDILKDTGNWRESDVMIDVESAKPYLDLKKLFEKAVAKKADVYFFGRTYLTGGNGVHDIHMNQGSGPGHMHADKDGNAIWQDGAVLFDFGDPQWIGYFTTFTQQNVPTNNVGDRAPDNHPIGDDDPGSMIGQA